MIKKVLLVSPNCDTCNKVKEYLASHGKTDSFTVVDTTTPEGSEIAKKLGIKTVPNCAIVEETSEGRRARLCNEAEFMDLIKEQVKAWTN